MGGRRTCRSCCGCDCLIVPSPANRRRQLLAMFLLRGPGALCTYRRAGLFPSLSHRCLATKAYDPLRILFCGSDDFSIASLKALHEEHVKRPDRIASIDVVCRPGKKVGRGLKQIREGTYLGKLDKLFAQLIVFYVAVPIKAAATALSLPIHEIDTFRGWTVTRSC